MAGDVTLAPGVARELATFLRTRFGQPEAVAWADLLDPRPVSLRDEALDAYRRAPAHDFAEVDAVLAVVKARIEALPFAADVHDVLALFGDES